VVLTANDYYAFGSVMIGREFEADTVGNYRYGFGGHEKDNEVSGEGNHLAFGDYGLDTRLGRRWNVEPLIKKYPNHSSYLVFANNPILFADPDGKDIVLAAGLSTKEKLQIVGNLQRLTNDKLVYSTQKDGTSIIKIVSLGTENSGASLNSGTNLIRTLNKKGTDVKTTTIDVTTGGNETNGSTTNANLKSDGTANTGEDATVLFNPSKTTGGMNEKGSTTRPTEISLGHELIHAKNRNTGTRADGSSGKLDPDGSGTTLSNEELNTRKSENKLRKEQGETLRKVPK